MSLFPSYRGQKLLVANRGEIAVRIIHTAKKLGLATVAIYTPSDALSPHVLLADESVALPLEQSADRSESKAYLSGSSIVAISKARSVTLLHPGYGFLSENSEFAQLVLDSGITWLGPRPGVIRTMGLKHEARNVALQAGLSVVPGSDILGDGDDAVAAATKLGFPIMLKATAGGGGMGMAICSNERELRDAFVSTKARAKALFGDKGLFIERYFPDARHIEIQVFGDGFGNVVHMGERECSIQRRQQKVIEESPSPFFASHPGLREDMCDSALRLCRFIKYGSAGTVEFLVDDTTARFYFLEMNTRIQVEHPVTEAIYPGLDLVELMIKLGFAERQGISISEAEDYEMKQKTLDALRSKASVHAIEGRVYAENPSEAFLPTPGLLQYVELNSGNFDWLRIDSWISTGLSVTPFFDALLCKLVVTGGTREEAISRFERALDGCKIYGPLNNIEYLRAIASSEAFRAGRTTTRFLNNFDFTPRHFKVHSAGIESTVQDLPGRSLGIGIPRSGPMDSLAFRIGNRIVGNPETTEALEIVILPGIGFTAEFFVPTVVAITGKDVSTTLNGKSVDMWAKIFIPRGGKVRLDVDPNTTPSTGFRVYLVIRGGLPSVPIYLGSKSTSVGLGGYQGRSLLAGDFLALGDCSPEPDENLQPIALPRALIPHHPSEWIIHVLPGPHDTEQFITAEGIEKFYSTRWHVTASINRMGIRLESSERIIWARDSGGEGGSHPSNILDNGYASGTININGDTPVMLGQDGPDMGGYVCVCTTASAEMWKLGQLNPGCTVEFRRISWADAVRLRGLTVDWLTDVVSFVEKHKSLPLTSIPRQITLKDTPHSPILHLVEHGGHQITLCQAGDSAILVEFGTMHLDLKVRAYIHAFQQQIDATRIPGLLNLCPCVRSILCHFDLDVTSQKEVLELLISALASLPNSLADMEFQGRRITFPIVLDDSWSADALARYMRSIREKAVYLPSNIEYLARNNGLAGGSDELLKKLMGSDWLVIGVGFYLGCPFLVPIDPRCRIVGQKMNPSRTYTPRGAIGIAGPVAAIYPIESPGGYQLFGRTLPTWQTWGKGKDFSPSRPWLLQQFDQIRFEQISEADYLKLEKDFDAGQYVFKIDPVTLSMANYETFLESIASEVTAFAKNQTEGMLREEEREQIYLQEWEAERRANTDSNALNVGLKETYSDDNLGSVVITAPLSASVWKIRLNVGDIIHSGDNVLMILEAMKTEIPILGGDHNIGRRVERLGKGITEGAVVSPGDVLVVLL